MIPPFIVTWARQPGPHKILADVRGRLEAGRLGSRAQIKADLTGDERRQVGQIADVTWAVSASPVRVDQLRKWLLENGVELEDLLVALGGPLRDLQAERETAHLRQVNDRQQGRQILQLLAPGIPEALVVKIMMRAPSWQERAESIQGVVMGISDAPERLAALAARLFADAHALDRSTVLGRAVARVLAARMATDQPYADPVEDVGAWHRAWASHSVICDAVSAQVLVLNLPLVGDSAATQLTAVTGEPVWLTLRSMGSATALAPGVSEVFVCENPAIVEAAADSHGAASKPLVCTYGFPNLATMTLLRALSASTTLRVRADGDTAGWRIVRQLLELPGSQPWRMDADETRYEEELLDELLLDLR